MLLFIFHAIGGIVMAPVRALAYPFELVFRSLYRPHESYPEEYDEADAPSPAGGVGRVFRKIAKFVFAIPLLILRIPVIVFQAILAGSKLDLLFLLPAVSMVLFFGFVFYKVTVQAEQIENRYRRGISLAVAEENYDRAKTYFKRLRSDGVKFTESDRLFWGLVLEQTGEPEKLAKILDELAPDDLPGYAPAHRIKALEYQKLLSRSQDPLILRKFRHHLENARDNSPEISHAWASYHLAVENVDEALRYLQNAANDKPELLMTIADINRAKGREIAYQRALDQAETVYRRMHEKDPLDVKSRLALASVLSRQEKFDETERLLLQGLKLQPEPFIKRATSDFYVMRFDTASQANQPFAEQFAYLQRALALDPNYEAVYQRLVAMFQNSEDSEARTEIKQALLNTVAETPSPMAHFSLSNVLWLDGEKDKAEWHVEQAFQLDNDFAIVVNNLAWMIAHRENPDLARALELAESAIAASPRDPRFLDTYATVLMMTEQYEKAIPYFQKALPYTEISKSVHQKLAQCYTEIGNEDLAAIHREKAAD